MERPFASTVPVGGDECMTIAAVMQVEEGLDMTCVRE